MRKWPDDRSRLLGDDRPHRAGKHVHAPHIEHVVGAAGDAEAPGRAAALARPRAGHRHHVPGAVADQRLAALVQVGADQLARIALGDRQPLAASPGPAARRTRASPAWKCRSLPCSHWLPRIDITSDRPKFALRAAKPQVSSSCSAERRIVQPRLAREQPEPQAQVARLAAFPPPPASSRSAPDMRACNGSPSPRARRWRR